MFQSLTNIERKRARTTGEAFKARQGTARHGDETKLDRIQILLDPMHRLELKSPI